MRIPEEEAESTDPRETDRASGPKTTEKYRQKKRYVGLSHTEIQHKQLYLAATHRNKSSGDYIWDIIEEHVQDDLAGLQRDLGDLVGRLHGTVLHFF